MQNHQNLTRRLDGKDILYLTANELRNNFGVVPQETMLKPELTSSGTIYDNAPPAASFSVS